MRRAPSTHYMEGLPGPLSILLMVKTSDDSFETSLAVPVDSTKEQREAYVKLWMESLIAAFTLNPPRAEREADNAKI